MYDIGSIYQARNVEDALKALAADPQAVVIAGGTDVLLQIRNGDREQCSLVSIHDLPELSYVREREGAVEIGALTSFQRLMDDKLTAARLPLLADAAGQMGGPQIRRMATIGGNVCRGLTSGDSAPALLCYNAEAILLSQAGQRQLPLAQFYTGPGRVDLRPGELLVGLSVKDEDSRGWYGVYSKYAGRAAMDIATVSVAALVKLSPDKQKLAGVRLAFGVTGPLPMRAPLAEAALTGLPVGEAVAAVAELVRAEINPRDSWRAGREFRLQIAGECAMRGLRQSIINAGGAC